MGNEFKDLFPDWEPGQGPGPGDSSRAEDENRQPRELDEKPVRVAGVYEAPALVPGGTAQVFVLLRDSHKREVRIFIGRAEAFAIAIELEGEKPERPMTHDLLKAVLDRLGASVERVVIDDIWRETYYAKLTLTREDVTYEVDCRPSDAMAVALRFDAPIYVAESVLATGDAE